MTVDSIPANVDAVTPEWLTTALQKRFPGVAVTDIEVLARHEETNAHARLGITYAQACDAPETMFCKVLPNAPERCPLIAATGMGPREAMFYADLAPTISALSPAAYVTEHGEDGSFVLLLEDLVASECLVSDGTWGMPPDAAARALEDLAELHIRFQDPARRAAEAPWVSVSKPSLAYGGPLLREALELHFERLNAEYVAIAEIYLAHHDELQALWHAGPHTVIHGDPHVGNLYLDAGRIGFLDWGIINVNTPMRDVSYFLTMAMATEDRRKHEQDLLRHYLDVCRASGAFAFTFDEAWLAHRVHGAYTVAASCGAAAMRDDVSPQRRIFAMGFLALAVAAVEDLESRAALREFGGL